MYHDSPVELEPLSDSDGAEDMIDGRSRSSCKSDADEGSINFERGNKHKLHDLQEKPNTTLDAQGWRNVDQRSIAMCRQGKISLTHGFDSSTWHQQKERKLAEHDTCPQDPNGCKHWTDEGNWQQWKYDPKTTKPTQEPTHCQATTRSICASWTTIMTAGSHTHAYINHIETRGTTCASGDDCLVIGTRLLWGTLQTKHDVVTWRSMDACHGLLYGYTMIHWYDYKIDGASDVCCAREKIICGWRRLKLHTRTKKTRAEDTAERRGTPWRGRRERLVDGGNGHRCDALGSDVAIWNVPSSNRNFLDYRQRSRATPLLHLR